MCWVGGGGGGGEYKNKKVVQTSCVIKYPLRTVLETMPNYTAEHNCSMSAVHVEDKYELVRWTEVAASLAGSLPALAYIIVLVATKAYREFIRRLSLYLAVTGLLVSATWPRWGNALTPELNAFHKTAQVYAGLAFGLIAILVSVYAFSIAVLRYDQSTRFEIAGIFVVFVLPLLVCWIPLLPICDRHNLYGAAIASVVCLQFVVSNAALFVVLARLIRRAADRDAFLYEHNKAALKRVLPLFGYVLCLQIPAVMVVVYIIHVATLDDSASVSLAAAEVVALVPCWSSILPFLLICYLPRRRAGKDRWVHVETTALKSGAAGNAIIESTSFSGELLSDYVYVRGSEKY